MDDAITKPKMTKAHLILAVYEEIPVGQTAIKMIKVSIDAPVIVAKFSVDNLDVAEEAIPGVIRAAYLMQGYKVAVARVDDDHLVAASKWCAFPIEAAKEQLSI